MRVHSLGRGFLLSLLFVVSFCNADEQSTFEVVGIGVCADCKEHNFKTSEAFSGIHVIIDCKLKSGEIKRVGTSELDKDGKFKVSLPQEMIQDGKNLKEECYAQLHSAAAVPCPAHKGLYAAKIVFKSQTNGQSTFGPTKPLQFSSALCTCKFLWPDFKYPPLSKSHPWKKNWPKISFPPLKKWPFPPLYKPKPLPPPTPIYKPKPKPPVVRPLPPPAPIYEPKPKPKPPVVKPPAPTFKPKPPAYKPLPPVYKPKPEPPVVKPLPPPAPVYKPRVVTKPLPPPFPLYPIPPFYKKSCPPFPKIPPKYFDHPKFEYFPPLPPFFP